MISSEVAIAVPCHRCPLTEDETGSWRSLQINLPRVPRFLIAPEALRKIECELPSPAQIIYFPDKYFTYPRGYNSLLLSKRFYASFKSFEYLLVYQLDCLLCKNELHYWCSKNWDYIGAPWTENFQTRPGLSLVGVGNGGFSLRNIRSALRVLSQKVRPIPDYTLGPPPRWWHWSRVRKIRCATRNLNRFLPRVSLETYLRRYYFGNEDVFWGKHAERFDHSFRVAPVEEALNFAFETDPEGSFVRNNHSLPFGVHAWPKYNREFWESRGLVPMKKSDPMSSGKLHQSSYPTITIVTPSFNQAGFAPDMISSVEAQNWPLEHIIFDAGSTDGSVDVWRQWKKKTEDERESLRKETEVLERRNEIGVVDVKVFVEADSGQSDAINKGMRVASGDIVGWLNADDVLMPEALEKVARAFENNPDVVCVYGLGAKADRSGNIMRKVPFRPFSKRRLRAAFGAVQPAMFFKLDAYWAVGGLDESLHYAMDWDLLLKLSKIGNVVAIPDHLANIRYYEETKTSTGGWKRAREIALIARRHNGIFDRNHLSFHIRTLLAKQPFRWPRKIFDHLCWNVFRDPPLMVQGWPDEGKPAGR